MAAKLDLKLWVSQQSLADELGIKVQNVHNWISRGKIESREYEFLPGQIIILVNKKTPYQSMTYIIKGQPNNIFEQMLQ